MDVSFAKGMWKGQIGEQRVVLFYMWAVKSLSGGAGGLQNVGISKLAQQY